MTNLGILLVVFEVEFEVATDFAEYQLCTVGVVDARQIGSGDRFVCTKRLC